MIKSAIIGGGTRLLVDTAAATGVAAAGVWYNRGSRDESISERGITHVVEHMLFKGTKTRSAFDIAREIDRLGGSINAFTEREVTGFHFIVPKEGFQSASSILCDMITDAKFDSVEFERERTVIVNELSSAEDDPEESSSDAFCEKLWADNQLGARIGGTVAEIAKIDRETTFSFYKKQFQGAPCAISVSGDVDIDEAVSGFSACSVKIPRAAPRHSFPCAKNMNAEYLVKNYQHIQVFCAFQIDSKILDGTYYPLQVANAAIGESMGSRLFQSLRENRGLCYSVYSSIVPLDGGTLLVVSATVVPDQIANFVVALAEELLAIRNGFSSREILDAQAHIAGGIKIMTADLDYRSRRIARQHLYGVNLLEIGDSIENVLTVGRDEAFCAIEPFFSCSPFVFAVGPRSSRTAFLRAAQNSISRF